MKLIYILIFFGLVSCSEPEPIIRKIESPVQESSGEPSFFKVSRSETGLSWLEKEGDEIALKYAILKSDNWSHEKTIVRDKKIVANWADFPGIAVQGEHWLAWYLQLSNPETFAYDVMITQSSNAGSTWSAPQKLHNDTTQTEHGFVSAVPAEGGFQLIWLDGRNSGGGHGAGAMNLRAAFVGFDGVISSRLLLDDRTCDCCQTALVSVDETESVAFYRDRSEKEVRDIKAIRLVDEGDLFNPLTIYDDNWKIEGCPVNGPRAMMSGKELAVAWFTIGEDEIEKVKIAFSSDGDNFSVPVLIDTANLGRIDLLVRNNNYYVSYLDRETDKTSIKIAELKDRVIMNIFSIADVSPSRKTGFPRIVNVKDGIMIAYTNAGDDKIEIRKLKLIDN